MHHQRGARSLRCNCHTIPKFSTEREKNINDMSLPQRLLRGRREQRVRVQGGNHRPLLLELLGTTEQTGTTGSNKTSLLTGDGRASNRGSVTNVLVVSSSY